MAATTTNYAPLPDDRTMTTTRMTLPTRWQGPLVAYNSVLVCLLGLWHQCGPVVWPLYVLMAVSTSVSVWLIVWMLRAPHPLKRGLTNYLAHW